jgi:Cdc6-like AAA superfamily ATPase
VRNNCILYGAPGTGKTEFARELNRALIERYGGQEEAINDPNDPNYGLRDTNQQEKKPKIPIFMINGEKCQTGGATVKDINTHEKLALIILHLKKEFFGDEKSPEPYIVFVDEADQAKNTTSYQKGNCLEE